MGLRCQVLSALATWLALPEMMLRAGTLLSPMMLPVPLLMNTPATLLGTAAVPAALRPM